MLVERLPSEGSKSEASINSQKRKIGHKTEQKQTAFETVYELARKGNEGISLKKPHTCCICLKICCNQFVLRMHLESVHLRTKKLSCDLCPKYYFTFQAIRRHMKKTHCKKILECNVCDYKTAIRSLLVSHKLTHNTKAECPICKKLVASLPNHIPRHKPKISCSICQITCHPHTMKSHMNVHRVRKCKSCDEVFTKTEDLRR